MLGGVDVPYDLGLEAHSDGDVLIHALCDALIGAAGLGDIGKHFPDTSERYENIDSRVLLRHVVDLLLNEGLKVGNVDITVVAQTPKLGPYIAQMREHLAIDLRIERTLVNVKATTTEHMGYVGRKEGIAAHAVALLTET